MFISVFIVFLIYGTKLQLFSIIKVSQIALTFSQIAKTLISF